MDKKLQRKHFVFKKDSLNIEYIEVEGIDTAQKNEQPSLKKNRRKFKGRKNIFNWVSWFMSCGCNEAFLPEVVRRESLSFFTRKTRIGR